MLLILIVRVVVYCGGEWQASPAHLLNLPVIPLGVLMSAVQPLVTRPPYPLAWMGYHVSAQGMMNKELFEKLVLTGFCEFSSLSWAEY